MPPPPFRNALAKMHLEYANNHYAGFSPATVNLFRTLCNERGIETPLNVQLPMIIEGTLFDMSGSSN